MPNEYSYEVVFVSFCVSVTLGTDWRWVYDVMFQNFRFNVKQHFLNDVGRGWRAIRF